MLSISLLIALTFWSSAGFPDSPTDSAAGVGPESHFTQALESFKSNDLTQSREHFTALLKTQPNDPVLLYNLGLVEMNDKHPGKALAYWRKALFLQPGYSPALAGMARAEKMVPSAQEAHEPWNQIFWRLPLWFFFAASLIFFFTSGLLWILFLARQKAGRAAPLLPPLLSTGPLFIFAFLAGIGWWYLHMETWATVLESPLAVRASPNPEAPSLLEFAEGDNVLVIRTEGGWAQVEKSSTALGWVPQDKILPHSGI